MATTHIQVRGAREHNLKDIDVDIPKDKLTVITGLSGSGKSSLAFDTIYAEGQRRYVESLSAYARQFLELQQKPDVDHIEGLSPAISIEQKTTSKNPRSTVGTVTEIYDYLRLLFARIGVPYSPATGKPISAQTPTQMVDAILENPDKTRLLILSPIVRNRKGEYRKELAELQKKGFTRVKIDGEQYELGSTPELDKHKKHTIEVVVDRIVIKDDQKDKLQQRLSDSIETALGLSNGLMIAEDADSSDSTLFSANFACPESGFTIEEIEPRLFSFNNPAGACPECDGLGVKSYFNEDLIVPDPNKTLAAGAVEPFATSYYAQAIEAVAKAYKASMHTSWRELPDKVREAILHGTDKPIKISYEGSFTYETTKAFEGVIPNLQRRWRESGGGGREKSHIERYLSSSPCDACDGKRLNPQALAVKIGGNGTKKNQGLDIAQVCEMSIGESQAWFAQLESRLSAKDKTIAEKILREINERLGFLVSVGLEYLTLNRMAGTLSGGESQRIRLASQIGSGLTGVLYVLDEPSIGLHQRDNERLLETLTRLRDIGNTVIVVEHDEDAIRAADHLIDMGPRAGVHGGQVVASGTPEEVFKNTDSLTADYMSGRQEIAVPSKRRTAHKNRHVKIIGATENNLKNVDTEFPLGTFTCVTGVSGGGKSSLVIETLYKGLHKWIQNTNEPTGAHKKMEGVEYLDKVIDIDQSPIGRTPRSNPATYTQAFGPIRDWFAGLPEAKARGYKPGRFSFNVKGGRCEACEGDGVLKIEMHFLPDVYVTCDECNGKRYNRETLEVKYKGHSIADILDMTVDEAADFFKAVPAIYNKLETLQRVGLGYIKVGQQATTLSGGEAQRVKLAKELSKRATGRTLYILDEPTTGLHFDDIKKLLEVLHELVETGNTVVVIEHNLDVIKTADYLIDIGPEGGHKGGKIVATGTPEEVAAVAESYTGQFLKPYLKTKPARPAKLKKSA